MPKYNSIDTIPAKVFFNILETKNYQDLRPKPKEKALEQVFISIYDEFFLKSDNAESNEYLRCSNAIAFLNYKIALFKRSIHFYFYNRTTEEMRNDFIKALKEGYDIEIDTEQPFIDEVKRVLTIEVGIMENDLTMEEMNLKNLIGTAKQKAFDYEANIVNLEGVIGQSIKDGIKLDKYIAYGKRAEKIIEKSKK